MQPIEYEIKPIKQRPSECMQTAATQLLAYHDSSVTLQQVLDEVPVYVDEKGEKIGTSPGHLASFFAARGYATTTYVFDVELFDISWSGLSEQQIIENLVKRQQHIPDNAWLAKYHHILVEGWKLYVEQGGKFEFPTLSVQFLYDLLQRGPLLVLVNSTYLNRQSKKRYIVDEDRFVDDSADGRSLTHAVTLAGYNDGEFLIVDPDPPADAKQHRWIQADHLIAAVMAAQTESDNIVVSLARDSSD